MKKIVYLWILLISFSGVAQSEALFNQGKDLYQAEKYQEALNKWLPILKSDQHSSALYFNIANAHYKLNNIGPSIYYYEKALQLDPSDSDIKNNLAFAENAKIDVIEPLPQTIFKRWYHRISGVLTYDGWAIFATLSSIFFVTLFLLYYFASSEQKKRLLFAASMVCVGLLLFLITLAFKTYNDFIKNRPAIIFAESIEVKSEPTMGSEDAFVLHEGTKVQIIDADDQWYRIALVDGKDGWIPATELKEL